MDDLWKIRQRKQMSLPQLSAKAGIPARLIQEYEAGRRPISMDSLEKLARALFVDMMEIKPVSSPIPAELAAAASSSPARPPQQQPQQFGAPPQPRPMRSAGPPSAGSSRPARPSAREAQALSPARESQIKHLILLAQSFGWDKGGLEKEIGKPLTSLNRTDASTWLKQLQERISTEHPQKTKKRRPYLPESVDSFELDYLQKQQDAKNLLEFSLFNGQKVLGRILGFGPYNITVQSDTGEITLNKLAIAYYRQPVEGAK
jgi:transcriptional regulator with XRE-family HTH domain